MALRYAVASGNWSSTATWNGGTLPTSADDVYSNNFTVAVDQNITVLSLNNSASAPAVAGGTFNFNTAGVTASITGATPLSYGAANLITVTNATGVVAITLTNTTTSYIQTSTSITNSGNGDFTFTCPNINLSITGNNTTYLSKTGSGTLTVNSNITMSLTGNVSPVRGITSSAGNIVINGNLSLTNPSSSPQSVILVNQTSGTLTITGNITAVLSTYQATTLVVNFQGTVLTINGNLLTGVGANVSSSGTTIVNGNVNGTTNAGGYGLSTSGVTTITGNISGNTGTAVITTNNLTVTGNVTTTSTGAGIFTSSAVTVTITGDITAGSSANAVAVTSSGGILRLTGNLYNVNNRQAFNGFNIFVNASTPMQARFFTPGIQDRTLYSEDTFPNQPAATNVRKSITYGPGSGLIGTLAMPAAADVRSGVVYDSATTGTALFTTALLLSEINSSATPVAVRLRNSATAEILGKILAAYKP